MGGFSASKLGKNIIDPLNLFIPQENNKPKGAPPVKSAETLAAEQEIIAGKQREEDARRRRSGRQGLIATSKLGLLGDEQAKTTFGG